MSTFTDIRDGLIKIGLPLLGAALPLPGGAALGTALAAAIGAPSASPDDILAHLGQSADAVQKAKEFELTHQETILRITVQAERDQFDAEVRDRDSARKREVDAKDSTNKILAFLVVCSFLGMVASTLAGWSKVDGALAGTLVGYLSAKCEQILAYYFGSSKSSDRKTELLAQAPPVNY